MSESSIKSDTHLKKVYEHLKGYKLASLICPILMLVELAGDVLIPYYMSRLVDVGIQNGDINYIKKMGLMMVFMTFMSMASGTVCAFIGSYAGQGFAYNLRKACFEKIMGFSFSQVDKFSAGSLITRLTNDCTIIGRTHQLALRGAVRSPFMMLFALIMAFKINSDLAKVFLVVIPVLVISLLFILKRSRKLFVLMREKLDAVNSFMKEKLSGIKTIKAFTREDTEEAQFEIRNRDLTDTSYKAISVMLLGIPIINLCIYTTIVAVLYFGGPMVVKGLLGRGQLISFISYNTQILISLMLLSFIMNEVMRGYASAVRLAEILNSDSEIKDAPGAVKTLESGDVSFENVCFKYPDAKDYALKDISFEIKDGEALGIIGPTGSSKSTLVGMIPRLYEVSSGSVKVDGKDVSKISLETLRDEIAYVMQNNVLFKGTLRENMKWGKRDASDEEILRALEDAQALDFVVEQGGLDMQVERGGMNFSGGQRQRLCIARALIKSAKILIMDDSMSALDMITDSKLQKSLVDNYPEMTKIVIAQRVRSIMAMNRILVLENGRVRGLGTHDELLNNCEIYREIYNSQERSLADGN